MTAKSEAVDAMMSDCVQSMKDMILNHNPDMKEVEIKNNLERNATSIYDGVYKTYNVPCNKDATENTTGTVLGSYP